MERCISLRRLRIKIEKKIISRCGEMQIWEMPHLSEEKLRRYICPEVQNLPVCASARLGKFFGSGEIFEKLLSEEVLRNC
jgi:hypothetical protein